VGGQVRLLRPGAISLSQLRRVVPEVRSDAIAGEVTPRVPGSSRAHYAPLTPLSVVPKDEIEELAKSFSEGGQRIAVLAQRLPLGTYRSVTWINAGPRLDSYAHDFYANLRTLDKAGCARILVQAVPADERWDAVRDRLRRAAAATAAEVLVDDADSIAAGILP
jgi:L-threonylcarbamoyladenylate synthase